MFLSSSMVERSPVKRKDSSPTLEGGAKVRY